MAEKKLSPYKQAKAASNGGTAKEGAKILREQGKAIGKTQEEIDAANKPFKDTRDTGLSMSADVDEKGDITSLANTEAGKLIKEVADKKVDLTAAPDKLPEIKKPDEKTLSSGVKLPPKYEQSKRFTGMMPKEKEQAYKQTAKSIWDAYANGDIDKSTRDYLWMNSLATFASNMGDEANKVAAAYGGGVASPENAESIWEQRQNEMASNEIQQEAENITGSPAWRKAYSEMQSLDSREIANKVADIQANYTEDQLRNMLVMQAQQIGMSDIAYKIANRQLNLSDFFQEAMDNSGSQMGQVLYGTLASLSVNPNAFAGMVGNTVGTIGNAISPF